MYTVKQGLAYAEQLFNEAKLERDTKGYRENLGYDRRIKLESKISNLMTEHYDDYIRILKHYDMLCDSL